MSEDILDQLFPACALAAFLEQAALQQTWPDREATRQRAYRIYEDALAAKNGRAVSATEVLPAGSEADAAALDPVLLAR